MKYSIQMEDSRGAEGMHKEGLSAPLSGIGSREQNGNGRNVETFVMPVFVQKKELRRLLPAVPTIPIVTVLETVEASAVFEIVAVPAEEFINMKDVLTEPQHTTSEVDDDPANHIAEVAAASIPSPTAAASSVPTHLSPAAQAHSMPSSNASGQLNLQDEDSEEERRGFTEPFPFPGVLNGVSPQLQSAATIKTDLSVLMQEIHNNVFEEHKVHPAPAWTKRNLRSCFIDEKQSVPTCNDLLDAHNLIAASVPEMTVNDVVDMVAKLFGPKRRHLCKIFEREQIDGAGLLLLNMKGFLTLLKIPIGPAITLDGICKRARELRNLSSPAD